MGEVRLKDIAEKVNLSMSAVSKALRGSSEIGEETTRRILQAANELGYHPNNSARALRLGKTFRIGVVLPSFGGVYADILAGIEQYVKPNGYSVIVLNTQNFINREEMVIGTLLSMPVDAILAVPVSITNYKNISVPFVFLSRYPYRVLPGVIPPGENFSYVLVDDFEGQRMATKHLIESCGKNIYIAMGCNDINNVWGIKEQIRIAGYRQALEEAGFPFLPDHVFWGAVDSDSGYDVVSEICRKAEPPFGLCTMDDIVAMGALHAIHEVGLRVPEDVRIVGYDNLNFCQHLLPPLTTVHSQKRSAGEFAAHYIIDVLRGKTTNVVHKIFEPRLCLRDSSVL